MKSVKTSRQIRQARHRRVRSRLSGTAVRPRLAVFRTLRHIRAQIIDDSLGRTLVAAGDSELKLTRRDKAKDIAAKVGKAIAAKALARGIKQVVFDRAGYAYHGRVQTLAEAARQAGLEF